jgi:signal transduction histidine kinase
MLLNDVRLFETSPRGVVRVLQAGDRHPFADRAVAYRRPSFDLFLPDEHPKRFFIRIHTDSTVSLQLVLWQPSDFEAMLQWDSLWIGALIGVVAISVFFFVQAWILNRDRLLLGAAGVTLAFALAAATNLGLLAQYLLPQRPELADALHPISMALFFPLLCGLFGKALGIRENYPRLHRLQWVTAALCTAAAISRVFDWYSSVGGRLMMAGMLWGLAWITVAAWMSWRARGRGLPTAVSLSLFTGSFAIAPLIALGILTPSRYFELFWVVGSVGFIVLAQMTTLAEVRSARIQRRLADSRAAEADRQAQRELAWRQQQSVYFAGVAHDLRTPLNALAVGLSNLRRALEPAALESVERFNRLQSSTRRLADMIERHLQILRLQQPGFELMLAETPIAECLEEVRAAVVDAWPDCEFRVTVTEGAPAVAVMDSELIVRALTNLMANAARAAPSGTPVGLTVDRDSGGGLEFTVRDFGPGLRGQSIDALFQVHWRRSHPKPPAAGEPGGFGIGLPMVHIIAELHHGKIAYQRADNGATVFTLTLPRL